MAHGFFIGLIIVLATSSTLTLLLTVPLETIRNSEPKINKHTAAALVPQQNHSTPPLLFSSTSPPNVTTIEILALDVSVDDWDWIDVSSCADQGCKVTPCCVQGRYVCTEADVRRANASAVHMEWFGVKDDGRRCGRECCERWADLDLDTKSRVLIGVQNEKDNWGRNGDPSIIARFDYFLTFKPASSITAPRRTAVHSYTFAEPAWAFRSEILSRPGGAANEAAVKRWADLSPGPSQPYAIAFIQNQCKTAYDELANRGLPIDSYGPCKHNRDAGFPMHAWTRDMYEQKLGIISRYVFDLAIENDLEHLGWNTERVFHALLVHTIPIYAGPPSVFQLIPHRDAIIYVGDFHGDWDALARYIRDVSTDPELRAKHLHWTTLPPSQWENGFPRAQFDTSRLSGAMCRVCQALR